MTTATTAKKQAKTAGAKLPQDHKEPAQSYRELDGAELLKPISQLRRSEAALLALTLGQALGKDIAGLDDEAFESMSDEDAMVFLSSMNPVGIKNFMDIIEDSFVVDLDAWDKKFPLNRWQDAMNLSLNYAGEVGKDKN
ncbi:hypothetical protein ACIP5Z_02105 [Rothia terrae]|uniref:hypothetical protein n=1 Tax=Rothia terrae TaxID=396015 RepID=UPI0037F48593